MIVIPMVGRSRRFFEAGYSQPKYRLPLHGHSVFALSVGSFAQVARHEDLLIVCLEEDHAADFARQELEKMGIRRGHVVELPRMTAGQADTVSQGLTAIGAADQEPIVIFNIDTFRPEFQYPKAFSTGAVDGYLECFIGSGANWSNVVPTVPESNRVIRTSEKKQESEYCCTGLYHFSHAADFERAYQLELKSHAKGAGQANELYVAPIYNHLIAQGADIRMHLIPTEQVIFCGIPIEYEELLNKPPKILSEHISLLDIFQRKKGDEILF